MKKTLNNYWLLISLLLLASCSKMYFPEPMPLKGKVVKKLPSILKGTYIQPNPGELELGTPQLQIKKLGPQHYIIFKRSSFSKDSLQLLVNQFNTDSTKATLKGNKLLYQTRDTVETTLFEVKGDLYLTPKDTVCEIDLRKGTYVDDFPDGKPKKLIIKKLDNQYFLNAREQNVADSDRNYWFVISFEFTDAALLIRNTSIHDSAFSSKLEDYQRIAKIQSLGSNQYLCQANDEQFFELFHKTELFGLEEWHPVVQAMPRKIMMWVFMAVSLIIIGLVGYFRLRNRKKAEV